METPTHYKKPLIFAFWGNMLVLSLKLSAVFLFPLDIFISDTLFTGLIILSQGLFILGIGKGRIPRSQQNPFGFTGHLYFMSFILTLILMSAGSLYTVFKGLATHRQPTIMAFHPLSVLLFSAALLVSFFLTIAHYRAITRAKGATPLIHFIKKTKRTDFISVFFEQIGSLFSILVVFLSLIAKYALSWLRAEAFAGIVIGLIIFTTCFLIGIKMQSLLLGESADMGLTRRMYALLQKEEGIEEVVSLQTLQMWNGSILLAIEAKFNEHLRMTEIQTLTTGIEQDIRRDNPKIRLVHFESSLHNDRLS
jgi:divalent metal cation (Fe/Co/Zn/Cd) transporter